MSNNKVMMREWVSVNGGATAQKMKFSIKDFSIKCDQIRRKLRIWSHLLKNSLMENLIFCAVCDKTVKCSKRNNYAKNWHIIRSLL